MTHQREHNGLFSARPSQRFCLHEELGRVEWSPNLYGLREKRRRHFRKPESLFCTTGSRQDLELVTTSFSTKSVWKPHDNCFGDKEAPNLHRGAQGPCVRALDKSHTHTCKDTCFQHAVCKFVINLLQNKFRNPQGCGSRQVCNGCARNRNGKFVSAENLLHSRFENNLCLTHQIDLLKNSQTARAK